MVVTIDHRSRGLDVRHFAASRRPQRPDLAPQGVGANWRIAPLVGSDRPQPPAGRPSTSSGKIWVISQAWLAAPAMRAVMQKVSHSKGGLREADDEDDPDPGQHAQEHAVVRARTVDARAEDAAL